MPETPVSSLGEVVAPQPPPAQPAQPAQPVSSPIRLLPASTDVAKFSGKPGTVSAQQFLTSCERIMQTSYVTSDADKIAFVSGRIEPGTTPAYALEGGLLAEGVDDGDYKSFREDFLTLFDRHSQETLAKGFCSLADDLTKYLGKADSLSASVESWKVSKEHVRLLRDHGWVTDDSMVSVKDLEKYFVFFNYLCFLQPKTRQHALSLKLTPTSKLREVMSKISSKTKKLGIAVAEPIATVGAAQVSKPRASGASGTDGPAGGKIPVCTYCKKEGHRAYKCAQRSKDRKKEKTATPTTAPAQQSPRPTPPPQGTQFCALHKSSSHSTENCFVIRGMAQKREQGRTSAPPSTAGTSQTAATSSGEAPRPSQGGTG